MGGLYSAFLSVLVHPSVQRHCSVLPWQSVQMKEKTSRTSPSPTLKCTPVKLSQVKNNSFAHCTICSSDFSIARGRLNVCKRHVEVNVTASFWGNTVAEPRNIWGENLAVVQRLWFSKHESLHILCCCLSGYVRLRKIFS